jgi:RNA polymerase-binding protein DksA
MQSTMLEQARTRLTEKRRTLETELRRLDEERIELTRPVGELSNVPTHNADRADEGLEVQIVLQDTLSDEVQQIDVALQRINDGTYGTCENCGQEISSERLAALPFATQCVECAQDEETNGA